LDKKKDIKEESSILSSKLSIAFLGTLVPDTDEFHNPAFNRSGNLVQSGIVEGFAKQDVKTKVLSYLPIPSYPKYPVLFCKRKSIIYDKKIKITLIPTINILILREIFLSIYTLFSLLLWSIKNRYKKKCIIVYNVFSPPLPLVYFIGKLTGSKIVAIIYDLGMPPKSLKLGLLRTWIYFLTEISAKIFLPKLDGRIVITEAIARDYTPNSHYLLIDGGISSSILNRLFPIELKQNRTETIFLCAGSLWEGNGVGLILNTMKKNFNPSIKIWFAGQGPDILIIKEASKNDSRIIYMGNLDLDQLFQIYKNADVLLNLRVISNEEGNYLFPSKLLEYLAVGNLVISTSVAHIDRDYANYCEIISEINLEKLSDIFDKISMMPGSELFEKGSRSRQFMLNNRTWDIRSEQILSYINFKVFS
jgi:glycosyltransferase involved in cell wall biosynthesis